MIFFIVLAIEVKFVLGCSFSFNLLENKKGLLLKDSYYAIFAPDCGGLRIIKNGNLSGLYAYAKQYRYFFF